MPADLKKYDKPKFGSDYRYNAAIDVVKALFPDFLRDVDSTVSPVESGLRGANGDYNLKTKEIRIRPDTYDSERATAVGELVQTILHELTHAQRLSPQAHQINASSDKWGKPSDLDLAPYRVGDYGLPSTETLRSSESQLGKKAYEMRLPSIDKGYADPEELIANLRSAKAMTERGVKSPWSNETAKLLEDPAVLNWVQRNSHPTIPSLKSWEPSMGSALLDMLKNVFSPSTAPAKP